MAKRMPISRHGYDKLREKLKHMRTVEMKRLERALGVAREHGDISDSGDYETARSEIWLLEKRIAELEKRLAQAEIVESCESCIDKVAFGAKVLLKNLKTREVETFRLVGEGETALYEDAASVGSPLGQSLIGLKVGDQFEVMVPAGLLKYEVLEISSNEE